MGDQPLPPSVMWAQRSAVVFVTINLEDVKDPDIKIEKDSVYFKGSGGPEKKTYEVKIPLYKEIDVEKSKSFPRDRCIEILLVKANPEESYWPSLTSGKQKYHWLKCDFNKWHDENDSDDDELDGGKGGSHDFAKMMQQMGGLGGTNFNKPSFDDIDDADDEEEDMDELLPPLE